MSGVIRTPGPTRSTGGASRRAVPQPRGSSAGTARRVLGFVLAVKWFERMPYPVEVALSAVLILWHLVRLLFALLWPRRARRRIAGRNNILLIAADVIHDLDEERARRRTRRAAAARSSAQ